MKTLLEAYVRCWGSAQGARRVYGLTPEEKAAIRAGATMMLTGCPPARGRTGTTDRIIVARGRNFYARVPSAEGGLAQC